MKYYINHMLIYAPNLIIYYHIWLYTDHARQYMIHIWPYMFHKRSHMDHIWSHVAFPGSGGSGRSWGADFFQTAREGWSYSLAQTTFNDPPSAINLQWFSLNPLRGFPLELLKGRSVKGGILPRRDLWRGFILEEFRCLSVWENSFEFSCGGGREWGFICFTS